MRSVLPVFLFYGVFKPSLLWLLQVATGGMDKNVKLFDISSHTVLRSHSLLQCVLNRFYKY